jgi:hypothetical protein
VQLSAEQNRALAGSQNPSPISFHSLHRPHTSREKETEGPTVGISGGVAREATRRCTRSPRLSVPPSCGGALRRLSTKLRDLFPERRHIEGLGGSYVVPKVGKRRKRRPASATLRRSSAMTLGPTRGGQSTDKWQKLHGVGPGVFFPDFASSGSGVATKVG